MLLEACIVAAAIVFAVWVINGRLYNIEVQLYNLNAFINLDLRRAARRYMHITNHEAEIHERIASIERKRNSKQKRVSFGDTVSR